MDKIDYGIFFLVQIWTYHTIYLKPWAVQWIEQPKNCLCLQRVYLVQLQLYSWWISVVYFELEFIYTQ